MLNVLRYGADPTGGRPSDAAFAAAIQEAVLRGSSNNRTGEIVFVPVGTYRLDLDLDLVGAVRLEGEGGSGNGGTRLMLGTGKCIYLHSRASGPYYGAGGAHLKGFDVYAGRPTFETWVAGGANTLGKCVRTLGDNRGYLECVVGGTSGSVEPVASGLPDLAYVWTPNNQLAQYSVRRAKNGRRDVGFVSQGDGTTGTVEPNWDFVIGNTTTDGTVTWVAAAGNYVFDGTTVWRYRWHSVVVFGGSVQDFYLFNFANFGVAIYGSVNSRPYTNANSWRVMSGTIGACGGGIRAQGPDTNGGLCLGVTANTIGYEENQTTAIPYPPAPPDEHPRIKSGGIGFWDNSFLGCSWIGCVAETCVGRGYYDEQLNGCSYWAGIYTESDCAPNAFFRGAGGGGIQAAGISRHAQGGFVNGSIVGSLAIRMDDRFPDAPYGRTAYRDLPGIWIFGDNKQGQNWWGWHKGYNNVEPYVWSFGQYPYYGQLHFGVQGRDHPDGAGWRDYLGHYCGDTGSGYFICVQPQAVIDEKPQLFRHGERKVGDRFEPPEGYFAGNTRYIGKRCSVSGYEGLPWRDNLTCYNKTNGYGFSATTLTPTNPNGYVYQCTAFGNALTLEPDPSAWPTTVGQAVQVGTATFICAGPVAQFEYYGACI